VNIEEDGQFFNGLKKYEKESTHPHATIVLIEKPNAAIIFLSIIMCKFKGLSQHFFEKLIFVCPYY